uniref:PNPLA domain-containing protein n=1 Tax=Romanomermis culicivorax TaxID=13658 RepID=A0A915JG72_ROMCU
MQAALQKRKQRTLAEDKKDKATTLKLDKVALSFCGCGFLGIYHLGSASCFRKHATRFLRDSVACVAGASMGSVAAALVICCPEKNEDARKILLQVAEKVNTLTLGALTPGFSIISQLGRIVNDLLPDSAHEIASRNLFISVTLKRTKQNRLISLFPSRDYLIKECIDGGFTDNVPKIENARTIVISPFCSNVDICPKDLPSVFDWTVTLGKQQFKVSYHNIIRGARAIFPPSCDVLDGYYRLGYTNTMKYLLDHGAIVGEPINDFSMLVFIAIIYSPSKEWDSWNFHTKSKPRSMVDSQIEHYRQKLKVDALKQAEPTQEVDYFQDIAPECKGNKKIIVRKKEDNTNIVEPRRDLFTVKQDVDIRVNRGVELGELDDTEAPTTNFDHSWDVDEENIDIDGTLKEIKNRERQERLQKHQQRNTEKLSQRAI